MRSIVNHDFGIFLGQKQNLMHVILNLHVLNSTDAICDLHALNLHLCQFQIQQFRTKFRDQNLAETRNQLEMQLLSGLGQNQLKQEISCYKKFKTILVDQMMSENNRA